MSEEFKVCVLPCNGIGRLVSTVVRQAAYKVAEMRPEEVLLVDHGALLADLPEALAMVEKYPLVVIDGCRPHCATVKAEGIKKRPAATVYAADVVAEKKISIAGEQRRRLGEKGMRLVDAVAETVVDKIDHVLAEEMMSTL